MKFNEEISKYVFKGVPRGNERGTIATLKNTLNGFGIYSDYAFDSLENFYHIHFDDIVGDWEITMIRPEQLNKFEVLTPEEFICKLVGHQVQLDWYNNLQVDDIVKIGYCDADPHSYIFGFSNDLVRKNYGNEFTIDNIINVNRSPKQYPTWHNGDTRAYRIKELDHFLPSSVFIPQFIPSTPIEKVILQSLPISDFNFLK